MSLSKSNKEKETTAFKVLGSTMYEVPKVEKYEISIATHPLKIYHIERRIETLITKALLGK